MQHFKSRMEPAALAQAVAARSGVERFFLTVGPDRADAVIPLSASLPDAMTLYLHAVVQQDDDRGDQKEKQADEKRTEDICREDSDHHPPDDRKKKKGLLQRLRIVEQDFTHDRLTTGDTMRHLYFFNRLGSELANERTMLAWIRTLLACIRTVFSYIKLEADVTSSTLTAATMLVATLLLLTGLNTGYRYWQVQRILSQKEKPTTYGRLTLTPYVLLAVAIAIFNSVETYSRKWEY